MANGVQGVCLCARSLFVDVAWAWKLTPFCCQALTLLDHLIKNGTERVVENARDHMFKLRQLSDFSYHDGSADKGAGGTVNGVGSCLTWSD